MSETSLDILMLQELRQQIEALQLENQQLKSKNTELKGKYDRLMDLSRKVRGHQREYFKYRASSDRDKSRYWERLLDQFIKDEVKSKESNQKELF